MPQRPNRIIVPEYAGPNGLSLVAAAELIGDGRRAMAAQVVDFAVRNVVTVVVPPRSSRRDRFTLVLGSTADRENPDELLVLRGLFGQELGEGSRHVIGASTRNLSAQLRDIHREITARLIRGGLARERSLLSRLAAPWRKEPVEPLEVAYPLVDHLWGVHDYVKLAERDRFRILQSPTGALQRPIDGREALLLNEKLLPYAVLFGLEKKWATELDRARRSAPSEWFDATGELGIADLLLNGTDGLLEFVDLPDLVDAADVLEGVGAFFGGLGDAIGNLDFPDLF